MTQLPDHGRDIGVTDYSKLTKFQLHLEEASKLVAKWPEWKKSVLGKYSNYTAHGFKNKCEP